MSQARTSDTGGTVSFVPVVLEVSDDVVVQIDALSPTTAQHVFADDADALLAAALFTDSEAAAAYAYRGVLRLDWARVGVVEAVAQRMPYAVDSDAVYIDRAVAWAQVGRTDRAESFLWSAQEWLLDQGQRAVDESLPAAVVDELAVALRVAAGILPEDQAAPCRDLLKSLTQATTTQGVKRVSAALERVTARPLVSLDGDSGPLVTALTGMVDPTSVPPRITAWRGAREPELSALHLGGDDTATFTLELAPDALPTDREARALVAWGALREDGAPWTSAVLRGVDSGSAIGGTMALYGRDPQDLVFGVTSIDGLDSVRADLPGLLQTRVTRLVLDAWAVDRLSWAAATLATRQALQEVRKWSGLHAVDLVDEAHTLLSGQLIPAIAQTGQRQAVVAAESSLVSLEQFQRTLQEPYRVIDVAHRPTLAELLVITDGPPSRTS